MPDRHRSYPTGILAVALLSSALTMAESRPFTLEEVMSAPFPSGLVAAPAGGKVAWVANARGVRNIWVAESPDYRPQAITSYTEDDGQEITELAWTPDARGILFTRGGELAPYAPNPRSNPLGSEQAVWEVSLAAGAPRKLAEGHSAVVSPKGDRAAFVLKDQIWSVSLAGDEKVAQFVHARGRAESLRWSPDGASLAFVSAREDHSFIGVYGVSTRTLRYLDPSVDRDVEPVWSPNGKQLAFLRLPASKAASLFGPKRSGEPWSIRVADLQTGQGREVWKTGEGRGSVFRGIDGDTQLFWAARDRLVFPWEGDGWTHLYSVPIAGGDARLLTPGEFEVENVTLTPDRRDVVFTSNQNDPERRHLWRVSAETPGPTPVTRGEGIEWSPVITSNSRIVLLRSDARWPARPALIEPNGSLHDLASAPGDFPAAQLVIPAPVEFTAPDGLRIHGQIFLPTGSRAAGRHPAVIFIHGGSRRQMLLGWHHMEYYHNTYALNQYLASRGYIVLSVNYRSGTGYGMEFREALAYGATGGTEFQDVKAAGLYLRSRPDVDPARIGLWGGSYGGYLTAMGLARASDLFACGVDLHGVHDWNLEFSGTVNAENHAQQEEWARVALASSPLADISGWRSPVLLIQGDDDRNVAFSQMVQLVEALRKQHVEFRQIVFPDEIHDFLTHKHWLTAFQAAADFFAEHLGGKE